MTIPANSFKAALQAGKLQIGLWQSLGEAVTAEICAYSGFDWLLIDGEHGVNDLRSIRDQLQVITPSPSHAIVRISSADVVEVKQVMDAGAETILVPIVNTADEAELMVQAMRYAPEGLRGNGAGVARVSDYGRNSDYLASANDRACLLVQAETKEALNNLEAICAVKGVDGVFIGPSDLASSLGHHGNPAHAEVEAAIVDAITRIRASGKAPGVLMADEARARRYIELGALFVAVGSDVALIAGGSKQLAARYLGGKEAEDTVRVY